MVLSALSIVIGSSSVYLQLIQLLQLPSVDDAAAITQSLPSESLIVQTSNPSLSPSPSTSSTSSESSLPDVFQKVENSVVQITSTTSNPNDIIIDNGVPSTGKRTALGSGFVYDNQGHIVTNYHVINGASRVDVTFTDGNTYSANVVRKVLTPI